MKLKYMSDNEKSQLRLVKRVNEEDFKNGENTDNDRKSKIELRERIRAEADAGRTD